MQANTATFAASFNPGMAMPVPWRDMVSHRSALVRFAKARLHDPMLAEDVVHDVFEAVLSGRAAFAGRAARRGAAAGAAGRIDRSGLQAIGDQRGEPVCAAAPGAAAVGRSMIHHFQRPADQDVDKSAH
jgi:hypothetical protein